MEQTAQDILNNLVWVATCMSREEQLDQVSWDSLVKLAELGRNLSEITNTSTETIQT
jgi:hypothetical protein